MTPGTDMQAYYAARAPYYDAVYLKPERQADIAFLSEYLPQRLAGRRVLEVACGTGYWTQFIARSAASLVATDAVAEPLDFARLRPHTGNVRFTRADAYALPDDLGRFDGAFAGLWFSHVPVGSRAAFLRSLHARLDDGARVILIDNSEVQCRELPIAERDAAGNTYQWRELRDGTRHRVLKNFPTETELAALVAPSATAYHFRRLDNFWLLEYEVAPRGDRVRI
jgi:demethylmenaquinone methyltransferase/2-methoxy-6-polyprenyl-1,4-benzoquinol methylase